MSDAALSSPQQEVVPLDLGLIEYRRCLAYQQTLHARVVAGDPRAYLLLVEHPPVLTLGKHADSRFLLLTEEHFKAQGIDIVPIDRGGDVTAHVPGQLVVYPILRLGDFRLTPKRYIHLLEEAVIQTLSEFGLKAWRDPEHPGVWTAGGKVCAVGVRIRARATLHGIALNCDNSLELFSKIVPCGIQGRSVTSVSRELARPVSVTEVRERLVATLTAGLMAQNPEATAGRLQCGPFDLIISSLDA